MARPPDAGDDRDAERRTRCFLGFELAEESRAYLEGLLSPLHARLADELGWPVRLVPAPNQHATLLFFAGLTAPERSVVWSAVEDSVAAGTWRALRFAWRGLALWPSPRRPGLLCVEAAPHATGAWPLVARLGEAPFSKGEVHHLRAYVPHITVMRFRRGRGRPMPDAAAWSLLLPTLPAIDPRAVRFDRVSFFLSTVSPRQPIYPRERTLALAP